MGTPRSGNVLDRSSGFLQFASRSLLEDEFVSDRQLTKIGFVHVRSVAEELGCDGVLSSGRMFVKLEREVFAIFEMVVHFEAVRDDAFQTIWCDSL